jgi:hypothetical protein
MAVEGTAIFRRGNHRLKPAPASSPDTPEAGAAGERDALREILGRMLCRADGMTAEETDVAWQHITTDYSVEKAAVDWAVAAIDRHTAKALETALRERSR